MQHRQYQNIYMNENNSPTRVIKHLQKQFHARVQYMYIEQCRLRKTLVNTTNFPTSFNCGRSQGVYCPRGTRYIS